MQGPHGSQRLQKGGHSGLQWPGSRSQEQTGVSPSQILGLSLGTLVPSFPSTLQAGLGLGRLEPNAFQAGFPTGSELLWDRRPSQAMLCSPCSQPYSLSS